MMSKQPRIAVVGARRGGAPPPRRRQKAGVYGTADPLRVKEMLYQLS